MKYYVHLAIYFCILSFFLLLDWFDFHFFFFFLFCDRYFMVCYFYSVFYFVDFYCKLKLYYVDFILLYLWILIYLLVCRHIWSRGRWHILIQHFYIYLFLSWNHCAWIYHCGWMKIFDYIFRNFFYTLVHLKSWNSASATVYNDGDSFI